MIQKVVDHALRFFHGGMQPSELEFLFYICINRTVIELGSMVGMSSYVIASVCKKLYCVDIWDDTYSHFSGDDQRNVYLGAGCENAYRSFLENCKEFIENGKITPYKENTATAIRHFHKINDIEVILFDADHSYEGIASDFETYREVPKEAELYIFHDYGEPLFPGVKRFCDELESDGILRLFCIVGRLAVYCRGPNFYGLIP